MSSRRYPALALLFAFLVSPMAKAAEWIPVGAAKSDITPDYPIVLAGYGSRKTQSEGVDDPLWARALAIGGERPVVLIAVDNCGVPRAVVERVARRVSKPAGLERAQLVVCSTHTHCAPQLKGYAPVLWGGRATPQQEKTIARYTRWLENELVVLARQALSMRRDCRLSWTQGKVTFAGNRRVLDENRKWKGFGFQPDSPVDHSFPLLVARSRDNRLVATWGNYACHCTTQGARNHISPDWAGYANEGIETKHPGCTALTTIGCGADCNPEPRGTLELAREHGRAIVAEVERLLGGKLTPLPNAPSASMKTVKLPFAELPGREYWEARKNEGGFNGHHATLNLQRLDAGEALPTHLPYPITTWTFGKNLGMIFLPGEVVVDYAVRLKTELDWRRIWINAWSNDVPCYIPSKRVLEEGGYEAEFSQVYYDRPTRFAPATEDRIVKTVHDLLGADFRAADDAPPSPYHRHPKAPAE